jgi:23S rRNA pseudouridine1911/1915/1917 synthase
MADILFKIEGNPPPRLDKALARNIPDRAISRSRLSKMIEQGVVKVNGAVVADQRPKFLWEIKS